ncbi:flavin reductase family protein [Streptosporangium carneum]|uniref:Flavin reductase n=1 Tax=Streptosporangium carneum TaxID=47481 RepID=A0A9W6I451_9ACTN|nr:flavin reductase family protein [Streptosporangium carneum]GLK11730.1 flavin reductase [Streptosporangium carneum]
MPVSAPRFRDALATVATAVSVATTVDRRGMSCAVTIGSLCALSLDPPLVLFCLARDSGSHPVFCAADRFAVTVLAEEQAEVARRCSGLRAARSSVPLVLVDRLPVVPGALAHLLCSTYALVDGGDHTIVIGEVEHAAVRAGRPLLYHQRDFQALAPSPGGSGEGSEGFGTELTRAR